MKAYTVEVIRNMFVFTANEDGIARFEKILGITPKATQSLDDRRIYIISTMNRRKMSLSELEEMLSNYSDGIKLMNDFSNMEMTVVINTDAGSLETLNKIIDEILPLNIYFEFSLQRETAIKYKMDHMEFASYDPVAAEAEYCNFDNNKTQIKEADYIQDVIGFCFVNYAPFTGQTICGAEHSLAVQSQYEIRGGETSIILNNVSMETPLKICGDTETLDI